MTKQRQAVYETVMHSSDHPDADSVYLRVKSQIPSISLATVYRNLSTLAAQGKIRRVQVPNLPDRFDKTIETHGHFICVKCGRVEDFNSSVIVKIPENFTVVDDNIVVKCICDKCNR